jgi:hypothetical protein
MTTENLTAEKKVSPRFEVVNDTQIWDRISMCWLLNSSERIEYATGIVALLNRASSETPVNVSAEEMPLDEALRIAKKGAQDYRDVPSASRTLLAHISQLEQQARLDSDANAMLEARVKELERENAKLKAACDKYSEAEMLGCKHPETKDCKVCKGTGAIRTGTVHMGMHEEIGCDECDGTGKQSPPTEDYGLTPTLAAVRMALNGYADDKDEHRVLEEIAETINHALKQSQPTLPTHVQMLVDGLNLLVKGPPGSLANDEVASWAGWIAAQALDAYRRHAPQQPQPTEENPLPQADWTRGPIESEDVPAETTKSLPQLIEESCICNDHLCESCQNLLRALGALEVRSGRQSEPPEDISALKRCLKFYADGDHFVLSDEHAWDTVSGEPQNFYCDEAGTATVEDGTLARMALEGKPINWDEDKQHLLSLNTATLATDDRPLTGPGSALQADINKWKASNTGDSQP